MKKSVKMMYKGAAVRNWNQTVPVGSAVDVTLDDRSVKRTVTESEAWLLGGHTPVIMLEGISGAYALARCVPVTYPVGASTTEAQRHRG